MIAFDAPPTLDSVVRDHVIRAIEARNGCISAAARELGIARSTVQRMLRRWRSA